MKGIRDLSNPFTLSTLKSTNLKIHRMRQRQKSLEHGQPPESWEQIESRTSTFSQGLGPFMQNLIGFFFVGS